MKGITIQACSLLAEFLAGLFVPAVAHSSMLPHFSPIYSHYLIPLPIGASLLPAHIHVPITAGHSLHPADGCSMAIQNIATLPHHYMV